VPGLGCLPSPPDARDFPIELAYEALRLTPEAAPPPQFFRPNSPLLDQNQTPQCVAYSTASMKADQDRLDMGRWFNFDEARFFYSIGGGPNGAYLRNAMGRMRFYGYPEQGGGNASKHKIQAYYAVPITPLAIKQALIAFGPIVFGFQWPSNWMVCPPDGVLPSPSGTEGGHAVKCYGYSPAGIYLRNSWGSWGARMPTGRRTGNCIVPWHDIGRAFEAWRSIDA
jgi:hypothetical protein